MYTGRIINETEERAVLHTALRNRGNKPVYVDELDVMPQINQALSRIEAFVSDIHSGAWLGSSGCKIRNIVNIGIGGSDLGPQMVCKALARFKVPSINSYFVSNVDSAHIQKCVKCSQL